MDERTRFEAWITQPRPVTNKKVRIRTHMQWNGPDADQVLTVFGQKKEGLHYNYEDRLWQWDYDRWHEGKRKAKEAGHDPQTAAFFETVLNYYHDTDTVDVQHILLGCNRSNGFPYLVFGYTYEAPSPSPAASAGERAGEEQLP